jgi:aminoglycoside 3-N-acetyltransferase
MIPADLARASEPVTRGRIAEDLAALGVEPGMTLLVHTSLSALGWVIGGEQAVIDALLDAVGEDGTVVMPTQSWQLCDPAYLNAPEVPPPWWPVIRDHLPIYDPARTPTRTMGVVAELFRTLPETTRSGHPHRSFAAAGRQAARITQVHDLDSPVGERSPLRALYDLGAHTLLIGVGHDKSTALHLAEHRSAYPGKHAVRNGAPLLVDGARRWVAWSELWVAEDDFEDLAADFAAQTAQIRVGTVGHARAQLVAQRPMIDFATDWFEQHRTAERFAHDTTAWPAADGAYPASSTPRGALRRSGV